MNNQINTDKYFKNKKIKTKINWKKTSLWLPFLLLSIFMIIIPLIMVFVITLIPVDNYSISDNWNVMDKTIWEKIGKSIWIAIIATIFCILIAFPFCYFLSQTKSKWLKRIIFTLTTMPMWLGSMIILISLKLFFDKVNGALNSTYGDIYTIIGIVYLYIPFMMIPLYNTLEQLPQNLLNASYDLGRGHVYTFFKVVIPFTKYALLSGVSMILLPAISVVAVPQFLNNDPNGSLIGDVIMSQGQQATNSQIALARVCVLSVVVSLFMFLIYSIILLTPKLWNKLMIIRSKRGLKNEK